MTSKSPLRAPSQEAPPRQSEETRRSSSSRNNSTLATPRRALPPSSLRPSTSGTTNRPASVSFLHAPTDAHATLISPAYASSPSNPQLLTRTHDADAATRLKRVASNASLVGTYRPSTTTRQSPSAMSPSSERSTTVERPPAPRTGAASSPSEPLRQGTSRRPTAAGGARIVTRDPAHNADGSSITDGASHDEDDGKKTGEIVSNRQPPSASDPDPESEAVEARKLAAARGRSDGPGRTPPPQGVTMNGRQEPQIPRVRSSRHDVHRETAHRRSWFGFGPVAVTDGAEHDASADWGEEAAAHPFQPATHMATSAVPLPPTSNAAHSATSEGRTSHAVPTVTRRNWLGFVVQVPTTADFGEPGGAHAEGAEGAGLAPDSRHAAGATSPPKAEATTSSTSWLWSFWASSQPPAPAAAADEEWQHVVVPEVDDVPNDQVPAIRRADPVPVTARPRAAEETVPSADNFSPPQASSSFLSRWVPHWGTSPAYREGGDASRSTGGPPRIPSPSTPQSEKRTPAEQVKADALARDGRDGTSGEPSTYMSSSSGVTRALPTEARDAVLNQVTRGSWVSYFSSRSARPPKRIEAVDGGSGGPEVMEIDFGELEPAGVGTTTGSVAAATRRHAASRTSKAGPTSTADTTRPGKRSEPGRETLGRTRAKAPEFADVSPPENGEKGKGGKSREPQANPPIDDIKPDPAPAQPRPVTPLTGVPTSQRGKVKGRTGASSSARAGGGGGGGGGGGDDGGGNGGGASDKGRSTASKAPSLRPPPPPNLVLPTFEDTFLRPPRSLPPPVGVLTRTLSAVNAYLFSKPADPYKLRASSMGLAKRVSSSLGQSSAAARYAEAEDAEIRLPRTWSVVRNKAMASSRGCASTRKVAVLGIHGWFSTGPLRNVFGEPTGTSTKFARMMADAVRRHYLVAGVPLSEDDLAIIPLEGDGRVADRVDKLFLSLISSRELLRRVSEADVVIVAAHSQGSIVATHLLARLIEQRHVDPKHTRLGLLAMCGIHHGPFAHLRTNIASYYLSAFESPAAKELFDFQSSSTAASRAYMGALQIVAKAGVKLVYIASVDDQVVPLYSALNSSASHPGMLRALYVDGQAFPRVDFLTNLLTFCVAVRNAGLSDHGLLTLLSASVAGSLYGGMGHSLVYEEPATYDLAARYVFDATWPASEPTVRPDEASAPAVKAEEFEAQRWNPYALPWALRGLLEDAPVRDLFGAEIAKLLDDYAAWKPTTRTLKDVQWRLEPMRSVARPSAAQQQPNATMDDATKASAQTGSVAKGEAASARGQLLKTQPTSRPARNNSKL